MKLCILDTGIFDHPALDGAVKLAIDMTGGNNPKDEDGHGIHVSGIIHKQCREAELLSAKIFPNNNGKEKLRPDINQIVEAIYWSVENGARLINMSWGGFAESEKLHEAILYANSKGCYSICAAGNNGIWGSILDEYPAAWDEVICVGSIGPCKRVTEFSSRNRNIDLVTPGKKIRSTWLNNGYKRLSGTSMSAPVVTGAAAQCMINHDKAGGGKTPIWCLDALRMHLIKNCIDIRKVGWDQASGFGILDPKKLYQEEA